MAYPKKKERNAEIINLRARGEKIEVVALMHGITPARVRHIVASIGKIRPKKEVVVRLCSVDGCGLKVKAKGLCDMHWTRQYRKLKSC